MMTTTFAIRVGIRVAPYNGTIIIIIIMPVLVVLAVYFAWHGVGYETRSSLETRSFVVSPWATTQKRHAMSTKRASTTQECKRVVTQCGFVGLLDMDGVLGPISCHAEHFGLLSSWGLKAYITPTCLCSIDDDCR
jgi:hypothetical protein